MAYTAERLEEALVIIRDERSKLFGEIRKYPKYDLRSRDYSKLPTTWFDDDPSGDFEPGDDIKQNRNGSRSSKRLLGESALESNGLSPKRLKFGDIEPEHPHGQHGFHTGNEISIPIHILSDLSILKRTNWKSCSSC